MSVDIEKLEALAKAATPGPWRYGPYPSWDFMFRITDSRKEFLFDTHIKHNGEANAAYITAACNAVPELIARVRELEKERFLIIHAIAGKYGRSEAVELQKFLEESKAERTAKED